MLSTPALLDTAVMSFTLLRARAEAALQSANELARNAAHVFAK
jgi:hypothetical protein